MLSLHCICLFFSYFFLVSLSSVCRMNGVIKITLGTGRLGDERTVDSVEQEVIARRMHLPLPQQHVQLLQAQSPVLLPADEPVLSQHDLLGDRVEPVMKKQARGKSWLETRRSSLPSAAGLYLFAPQTSKMCLTASCERPASRASSETLTLSSTARAAACLAPSPPPGPGVAVEVEAASPVGPACT